MQLYLICVCVCMHSGKEERLQPIVRRLSYKSKLIKSINQSISIVQCLDNSQSCTSKQLQGCYNHFISFYVKFKQLLLCSDHSSGQHYSMKTPQFVQWEPCTPSLCMPTEVQVPTNKACCSRRQLQCLVISQLYSQPASTLPYALASNLCYDQLQPCSKCSFKRTPRTLIRPGHYPDQWVTRVSDADPVSTRLVAWGAREQVAIAIHVQLYHAFIYAELQLATLAYLVQRCTETIDYIPLAETSS